AQEIISLGEKAGIAASAVAAGVILLVHRPTRDCFGWGRLFQVLRFPIVCSVIMAVLLGLWMRWWFPSSLLGPLDQMVGESERAGFRTVIGAHYGLYIGGILGTFVAVIRLRHLNRQKREVQLSVPSA
ncbi:MAG: hypothetical protein AAGJ31_13635, partial [Verrucomicrobiota bacterium]